MASRSNPLHILGMLVLASLCSGCLDDTILDIALRDQQQLLVVNSHLDPDERIRVSVTQAIPVGTSVLTLRNLRAATVDVFEEGRLVGTAVYEPPVRPGANPPPNDEPRYEDNRAYFVLDYRPKAGFRYTLRVRLAGYPEATATDVVPPLRPEPPVLRVTGIDQAASQIRVEVEVRDTDPQPNGYHLLVSVRRPQFPDVRPFYVRFVRDDTQLVETDANGILFQGGANTGALVPDRILPGGIRTFAYTLDAFFATSPDEFAALELCPEWRTVTPAYFDYYSSLIRQEQTRNDPFVQPFRIVNNVQGGLGNVSGFAGSAPACVRVGV